MYKKRVEHTSIGNKLFFKDHKKKKVIYETIAVCFNDNEAAENGAYDVIAYGRYAPLIIPILRPESPSLEHNLLYKAAKMAKDKGGDGVILDTKNDFRVIKYRK